jgi:phosphomannomutase
MAGTVGATGTAGAPPASTAPLGTPTVARLSQLQWANSVRDLLFLTSSTNLTLATADAVVRLDNEADSLFVSQDLHDDFQSAAESLAAQIAGSTTAIAKLVPIGAPTDNTGKATAFIQSFGRSAYRRPLTSAEVQAYLALFNKGPSLTTGYSTFAAGVRVTLEDGTWGLVRASSNKPSLVVVVESPVSEAAMRAMFKDIDTRLSKHPEVGEYDQKI